MESDKNRDFAKNPRTKEESVGLILKAIEDDKLITSKLHNTDYTKFCALGCLFTIKQLKWLAKRVQANEYIDCIFKKVGEKNMKAMTGLNLDEASLLAGHNDISYDKAGMQAFKTFLNNEF